jgi:hypothetical protein
MNGHKRLIAAARGSLSNDLSAFDTLISCAVAYDPSLYERYCDVMTSMDVLATAQVSPELTDHLPPSASKRGMEFAFYVACRSYVDCRTELTIQAIGSVAKQYGLLLDDSLLSWIARNCRPATGPDCTTRRRCLVWDALCRVADTSPDLRQFVSRWVKPLYTDTWRRLESRGFQPTEELDERLCTIVYYSPRDVTAIYKETYGVIHPYMTL